MIIYRIMVKTSDRGGIYMDGTHSLDLAIQEAQTIQSENPSYKISIQAEDWPTLSLLKYRWYQITGRNEGLGTGFQKRTGHKSSILNVVWPDNDTLEHL